MGVARRSSAGHWLGVRLPQSTIRPSGSSQTSSVTALVRRERELLGARRNLGVRMRVGTFRLALFASSAAALRVGVPALAAPRAPPPQCVGYTAALLFDCDGVIVETEELHRRAYNSAFEQFGLQVNGEQVVWETHYYDKLQNTVGGGKPKMRWHFMETCGGQWPTCTLRDAGRAPATEEEGMALIDDLQDAKTEFYKKIVDEAAEPRPGVIELMDAAIATPGLAVRVPAQYQMWDVCSWRRASLPIMVCG